MKLFLTAFIQVFLIAINTVLISKSIYVGIFVSTFMINMVWSYNVKRVSIGDFNDRVIYSLGASLGSITGVFIINYLI